MPRASTKPRGEKEAPLIVRVRELERRFKVIATNLNELGNAVSKIDENLMKITTSLNSLMRANNSVSAVVSSMEAHLDATTDGKWDDGKREEIAQRLAKMERRKILWGKTISRNLRSVDSVKIAEELWDVAREIGTERLDAPAVLQQYLKGGRIDRAEATIAEIRERQIELNPEVDALVKEFEARIASEKRKAAGEVESKTEPAPAPDAPEYDPELAAASERLEDKPEDAVE